MQCAVAAGSFIAGYQVERPLGAGGMGAVYLARSSDGTPCALKLLNLEGAGGSPLRLVFEREVAACRRLIDPCIVQVLDTGLAGEVGFVAMELMAAGDLALLLARQPAAPRTVCWAVEVATCVARALVCAHERGVLHRDVKPANILLAPQARLAKLSDFGLARMADLQRSRTGVLAGTPAYMSPEQLTDGVPDARSDLYSLGAVLFELLCGRPPHQAASLGALLREVSSAPPSDVRALRPDVPGALADLVARLLAKHPDRRPATARVLASELAAIGQALGPASRADWPAAGGPVNAA